MDGAKDGALGALGGGDVGMGKGRAAEADGGEVGTTGPSGGVGEPVRNAGGPSGPPAVEAMRMELERLRADLRSEMREQVLAGIEAMASKLGGWIGAVAAGKAAAGAGGGGDAEVTAVAVPVPAPAPAPAPASAPAPISTAAAETATEARMIARAADHSTRREMLQRAGQFQVKLTGKDGRLLTQKEIAGDAKKAYTLLKELEGAGLSRLRTEEVVSYEEAPALAAMAGLPSDERGLPMLLQGLMHPATAAGGTVENVLRDVFLHLTVTEAQVATADEGQALAYLLMLALRLAVAMEVEEKRRGTSAAAARAMATFISSHVPPGVIDLLEIEMDKNTELAAKAAAGIALRPSGDARRPELLHCVSLLRLLVSFLQSAKEGTPVGGALPRTVQTQARELQAGLARLFPAGAGRTGSADGGGARGGTGARPSGAGGAGGASGGVLAVTSGVTSHPRGGSKASQGAAVFPGPPYVAPAPASTTVASVAASIRGMVAVVQGASPSVAVATAQSSTTGSGVPGAGVGSTSTTLFAPGCRFPKLDGTPAQPLTSAEAPAAPTAAVAGVVAVVDGADVEVPAAGGAGVVHAVVAPVENPALLDVVAVGLRGETVPGRAVADSGSTFNIATQPFVDRARMGGAVVRDIPTENWVMRSVTNEQLSVTGAVQMVLRFTDGVEEEARFAVVEDDVGYDLILHRGMAVPYFQRLVALPGDAGARDQQATVAVVDTVSTLDGGTARLDSFPTTPVEAGFDMALLAAEHKSAYKGRTYVELASEEAERLAASLSAALAKEDWTAAAAALQVPEDVARRLMKTRVGVALTPAETASVLWLLGCKWGAFVPHPRGIKDVVFEIEMAEGARKPFVRAGDRLSPGKQAEAIKCFNKLVDGGMGEWVNESDCALDYFLVPKPGGAFRMVINGKAVNDNMRGGLDAGADAPDMRDTAMMAPGTLNSTVDMCHAFFQCRSGPVARSWCVLQAPPGAPGRFFRLNVMAMGLTTAPGFFQRTVRKIFEPLIATGHVYPYLDDVLARTGARAVGEAPDAPVLAEVGTAERAEQVATHMALLSEFLQSAIDNGAFFDLDKTQLAATNFRLLGRVYGPEGRLPPTSRLDALRKMGLPLTVPKLRSWLGMVTALGEYGLTLVEPMRVLLDLLAATQGRGGVAEAWGPEQQAAYNAIMERLDHLVALHPLDRTCPVEIEVDASASGWASVYSQRRDAGRALLALHAQQWTKAEEAFTNTNREFAGLLHAVQHIAPYTGALPLVVYTDHQNTLAYVANPEAAAHPMMQRWAHVLAWYPVEVRYRPGTDLVVADRMSRWPWNEVTAPVPATVESAMAKFRAAPATVMAVMSVALKDTEAQLAQYAAFLSGGGGTVADTPLIAEMQTATEKELRDGLLPMGLKEQRRGGVRLLAAPDGKRTYIPEHTRARLLRHIHELEAHATARIMCARLAEARTWWPTMEADVEAYVTSCHACQRFGAGDEPARHATLGTRGEVRPREWLLADHAGPYTMVGDERFTLLVMLDHATRFCVLRVVPDATAAATWKALTQAWFTVQGPPRRLLTDRGSAFDNAVVAKGCAGLGIEQVFGVRSEDQARVERLNKEIGRSLRRMNAKSLEGAEAAVAQIAWHLNTRRHSALGMSPFTALFGVSPRSNLQSLLGDEADGPVVGPEVAEAVETVEMLVRLCSERAFDRAKAAYDKGVKEWAPEAGSHVFMWLPNRNRKLDTNWKGPVLVRGMHSERVVRVYDPVMSREMLRHVSHLRPYDASRTSAEAALEFELPDGFFLVEKVLEHRSVPRKEVLIHWANSEPEDDSWEPLNSEAIRSNSVVRAYCAEKGVRMPPVRRKKRAGDSDEDSE